MTFLTNWVFWAIVIVIIILLAIIGYLAEGTTLGSKNKKKQQQTTPEKDVEEIEITEENNAPSAWTGEIKKDERHEQIHDVPSVDDWSTIPTDTPAVSLTEEPLANENVQDNSVAEVEQINPSVLENLDAPLTDTPVLSETKLEPETAIQEPIIDNVSAEIPEVVETPNLDTVQPAPALTLPDANLETNMAVKQPQIEHPAPTLEEALPTPEVTETPAVQTKNALADSSQMIQPAPIFDAPVVEAEPEKVENLEVPKETEKQEANTEDVWK